MPPAVRNGGGGPAHFPATLQEAFGSVMWHMATKTPSHSTRGRRSPAARGRRRGKHKVRSDASSRSRATTRRGPTQHTRRRHRTRRHVAGISLPKPPPPEQVIAAVREELDRLSERWKSLLPKLKKTARANGVTRG